MLNFILGLCGSTLLILAAVVVYSNYRSATNKWLGGFLLSGFLWLLANLMANMTSSEVLNLYFTRSALVGAVLIPLTYLMFCLSFMDHRLHLRRRTKIVIFVPIVAVLLTTPTGLNVRSVSSQNSGFTPGISYLFLLIILVAYFFVGTLLMVKEYKRSTQLKRQQLYYILLGTGLTVVPAAILNGILPLLGHPNSVSYGPTVVIFFAIFTSIAIVKHKLFDIRLIIARSLGYAASLLLIATIYGVIVLRISSFIFNLKFSLWAAIFISTATGIAGLSFQTIQRKFDKLTNKLFYRDAYDAQAFLDEFNKILVSNYELNSLLKKCAGVIEKNLKPTYCVFGIKETAASPQRLVGTKGHPIFEDAEIQYVRSKTPTLRQKTIIVDALPPNHAELQQILQRKDVAVIGRLTQSVSKIEEGAGYLILGPKKSGNMYGSKDERIIEILINELVIAIQNSLRIEQIETFNITLQEKVVDATHKLRRYNEKLKAMDEAKDDFISMASHQLRTPLTAVKGYISMVLEEDAGKINKTQRDMLGQAYFGSQRMVYLIADLLNVSRLKTGKFIMEPSSLNLATMIEQEMRQLKETAEARNLTLRFDKPVDFPDTMLDETKTRQVIMNFIDNAIYYTPAGGRIRVSLAETQSTIEMRVEDDGIGVPKHEQAHLFTKFYRAGNARQARPDGTGLGLFMAKKVIVGQGGSVLFESIENKGSTFGFVFSKSSVGIPVRPATLPVAEELPQTGKKT